MYQRLIIVDDASDAYTADWLFQKSRGDSRTVLIRSGEHKGFVHSVNAGLAASNAESVAIVNSDVVLCNGWLERLLHHLYSSPEIALVNPLTNKASTVSFSMPAGCTFLKVDKYLFSQFKRQNVDIVTGVGFCMLLKRSALDDVGYFDEAFSPGYCEESDLCMRLYEKRYRTVAALDTYVFHYGSASFLERNRIYRRNRKLFDERWAAQYAMKYSSFKKTDPLRPPRETLSVRTFYDLWPLAIFAYRRGMELFKAKGLHGKICNGLHTVRRIRNARTQHFDTSLFRKVHSADTSSRFSVTYIVPRLVVAGGVLSITQIVNELILQGVDARIATLAVDPQFYDFSRMYCSPMVFKSYSQLIAELPKTDIVVSSHWETVESACMVKERGAAGQIVSFWQDYEPFFEEGQGGHPSKAIEALTLANHHIVKSDWLVEKLRTHGVHPHKTPFGLNVGTFYPHNEKKRPFSIVAMARPGTPRRGFADLITALTIVGEELENVHTTLFGDSRLNLRSIPFDFEDLGIVFDQNTLAKVYSRSVVFVDASLFQGFGRCAMEAMSCGIASVLTNVGGVTEYAKDGYNALMVPPNQPKKLAKAILRVLKDPDLASTLAEGGRRTAATYCHKVEGQKTYDLLEAILVEPEKSF